MWRAATATSTATGLAGNPLAITPDMAQADAGTVAATPDRLHRLLPCNTRLHRLNRRQPGRSQDFILADRCSCVPGLGRVRLDRAGRPTGVARGPPTALELATTVISR